MCDDLQTGVVAHHPDGEIVGNDDCRDSASPYSAACSPGASGATTTRRVLRAFAPDRGHGVG
ncbi:hypothetical protein [Propionibacterium freudenreichii]|uniref:hypothetical protein n=1 Tax=Propionibacterium freudenreichii TaxID=1744 RepID=UPI0012FDAF14|nr:hypothetical protein [Propionibacterium freudenreichii]MDK9592525.1 hypothetical protein [Propionibacterium freudenreichii]WFF33830.1 hypothetical protein FAM19025_000826 [Propionibacterium freudenreichii]WFF36061.1 hypothetical protein FAM14221_000825 [Propionibacterium freudenreichii]